MRISVLSAGNGWHVQDLRRAAGQLAYALEVIDFRRIADAIPALNGVLSDCDRVLVRTMPPGTLEQVVFRMSVLHRLHARGVPVLNPPAAIEACVDKYLASARLHAAGVPTPATWVGQQSEPALEAFTRLGGDVIVKPLFGSEGRGMVRVSDPELAWRTLRTLERLGAVLYLQQFIANRGFDLRAFVRGDEVIAAMRRSAKGDWRTNVAQGGQAEVVTLTAAETELALRAAFALGAPVCGVDLLPACDDNTYVLEVNSVPGWRALAPIASVDIAREVLLYLVNRDG